MSITTSLYIIFLFIIILYVWIKEKYNYWYRRDVPYITPTIPYGNFKGIGKEIHSSQLLKKYYDEYRNNYPLIGMYFFSRPAILLNNLDLIKAILVKDFAYFPDRGFFYNEKDDPLSSNLFTLNVNEWKHLRPKLTPTFTSVKMKYMFSSIITVANELKDTFDEMCNLENEIEIKDILARFTTDVIGTCAFGIECNSLKDPNSEFRKMGKLVFERPKNSGLKLILIFAFPSLAEKLRITSTRKEVSDFFLGVVKETMEYRIKNNIKRNDFMDLLIQLSKTGKLDEDSKECGFLTFNEVAAQAFVFFLAGFETSSTTMSYCLYELAINPEIQDKARAEIRKTLQKHNGEFTYEAMAEMVYIEQIVNESLRKYPPGASLIRKTYKNYLVPGTSTVIEKGTTIWIPVYGIHHNPELYPEPEVFNPNRFQPDAIKSRHPCSFLAFGDGPRNCIGLRFGMMQAKIGLIMLLKNFIFKTCSKTSIPLTFKAGSLVLTSKEGIWLQAERIK